MTRRTSSASRQSSSRVATTLAHLIIEQSDRVGFSTFDTAERHALRPSTNMAQIIQMTEVLDEVKPVEKTAISGPLLDLANRAGRRGIVIILSDFFVDLDDLEAMALPTLRHRVILTIESELDGVDSDELLTQLVQVWRERA